MFEESCDAADVPFQTCLCLCGLQLSVKGYSDKQNILLKKIIEKMATFEIDERRFDIIKEAVSAAGLHPQLQEASSSSADVSPLLPPPPPPAVHEVIEQLPGGAAPPACHVLFAPADDGGGLDQRRVEGSSGR